MTENIAKKNLITLLPKESFEGKDFLNNIYYDKDGYIIASNNYVLCAIKCEFDKKKLGTSENKEGKKIDTKYPIWGHLFKGKSFNSISIDYDKIDKIIDDCKNKIKKLPKSKHKLSPQGCQMIKFGKTYFNILNFEKFIKMAKLIKATELYYGGSDDRMMASTKDGKIVINPLIWYDKDAIMEEPIDYLTWKENKTSDSKKSIKKIKNNPKKLKKDAKK